MATPDTKYFPEAKEIAEIDRVMEALPEIQAGKDLWQNNFHEFDVYGHTMEVVKQLKEILKNETGVIDLNLLAAGWLHDIGKPAVASPKLENGVPQQREPGKAYHKLDNHEVEGEKIVLGMDPKMFSALGLDQKKVAALVFCQFIPLKGIRETRKTGNWPDFLSSYNGLKDTLDRMEKSTDRPPISKKEIRLMFLADKLGEGDSEKYVTDRGELLAVRDAVLAENPAEEERILKEVYDQQKREAEVNEKYAVKE